MFSIEVMQMCASIDGPKAAKVSGYMQDRLFTEHLWPTCTCPAYKFAKRTINFGGRMVAPECKHILEAQKQACGWHQQYCDERQTRPEICPRCGGPTLAVRVLV